MALIENMKEYLAKNELTVLNDYSVFLASDLAKDIRNKEINTIELLQEMFEIFQSERNNYRPSEAALSIVKYAIKNSDLKLSNVYKEVGISDGVALIRYFSLDSITSNEYRSLSNFYDSVTNIIPSGMNFKALFVDEVTPKGEDAENIVKAAKEMCADYSLYVQYLRIASVSKDAEELDLAILARIVAYEGFDLSEFDRLNINREFGASGMAHCIGHVIYDLEDLESKKAFIQTLTKSQIFSCLREQIAAIDSARDIALENLVLRKNYVAEYLRGMFVRIFTDAIAISVRDGLEVIKAFAGDDSEVFAAIIFGCGELPNGANFGNLDVRLAQLFYSNELTNDEKAYIDGLLKSVAGRFFRGAMNTDLSQRSCNVACNIFALVNRNNNWIKSLGAVLNAAHGSQKYVLNIGKTVDFLSMMQYVEVPEHLLAEIGGDTSELPKVASDLENYAYKNRFFTRQVFHNMETGKAYDYLMDLYFSFRYRGQSIPIFLEKENVNKAPGKASNFFYRITDLNYDINQLVAKETFITADKETLTHFVDLSDESLKDFLRQGNREFVAKLLFVLEMISLNLAISDAEKKELSKMLISTLLKALNSMDYSNGSIPLHMFDKSGINILKLFK